MVWKNPTVSFPGQIYSGSLHLDGISGTCPSSAPLSVPNPVAWEFLLIETHERGLLFKQSHFLSASFTVQINTGVQQWEDKNSQWHCGGWGSGIPIPNLFQPGWNGRRPRATFPSPCIAPRCNEILLEWDKIVQEQQGKAHFKLLVWNKALVLHGQSPAGRDRNVAYLLFH